MTDAEVSRYLDTPRGQVEAQLWMFSYKMHHQWPERLAWWIAFRLPRKIALFAMVRVAAASGLGPDQLTYDVMHKHWEKGEGR